MSGTAIIRFYYRLKHKLEAVFYCWKIVKALSLMNNNKSYKKEEVVIMKKKNDGSSINNGYGSSSNGRMRKQQCIQ